MDEAAKSEIVAQLTEILIAQAPDANLRPMYGGTIIELVAGDPKSQIGGFFAYTGHVSFEFSHGAALDDPRGLLEGKGKFRRHLKLRNLKDIAEKDCLEFLKQAIAGTP